MSEIWEPWVPEVGQRVRLRASMECPFSTPEKRERLDGATGDIIAIFDRGRFDLAHRFRVRLDIGVLTWSAASELIPLEDA